MRWLLMSGILLASPPPAWAHGGGLDALGCHNDRARGDYHCHKGPLSGRQFSSKRAAQQALKALRARARPPQPASRGSGASDPTHGKRPHHSSEKPARATRRIAYDRELYGGWRDSDDDCQNTRDEVLIQEADGDVALSPDGCDVLAGRWQDPYTGRVFKDPSLLDIDHLVPLREVHLSGGYAWSAKRREAYANDLGDPATLVAVYRGANRSKGADDPAQWMPPNRAHHCTYIRRWVRVKKRWQLRMDAAERAKIKAVLARCE